MTYHFRAVASNSFYPSITGADQSFTSLSPLTNNSSTLVFSGLMNFGGDGWLAPGKAATGT